MFAPDDIEGVHGLTFDINILSEKFQLILKYFKCWSCDYDIKKKSSLEYFHEVIKRVNKMENDN